VLLALCVVAQFGLLLLYLVALAFLPRTEAWLDIQGRLTLGFAVATVAAVCGLLARRRSAQFAAMLTPAQLVWYVVASSAEQESLGAGIVVAAAGLNAAILWLLTPVFVSGFRRALVWDGAELVWAERAAAAVCLAAFGIAFIDPGPHPPSERLEPTAIGTWREPNAAGETTLPDGRRIRTDDIRMIPRARSVEQFQSGDEYIYGTDSAGATWLVQLVTTDLNGGCWRLHGPAFQAGDRLLISPLTNEMEPAPGVLLPIAPLNATEAEELARPRLIGSYCLDRRLRVRSHDPPAMFGH
jgi:hypothetical protein